jgi:hypothetical protein
MFGNTNMGVLNLAFPDVCEVIAAITLIPTPLINLALSFTHIPSVFQVLLGCGFAENLLTTGTISNGDEAGLALGVVSILIIGPDRPYTSSIQVMYGTAPATRMTTVTGQNGFMPNAPGISLTPSQVCVLILG